MTMPEPKNAIGYAMLALIIIGAFVMAKPVRSQQTQQFLPLTCKPTAEIEAIISERFGETGVAAGITQFAKPLLIYRNKKTRTFTIVTRQGDGTSCVVSTGTDWTPIEQGKDGVDL